MNYNLLVLEYGQEENLFSVVKRMASLMNLLSHIFSNSKHTKQTWVHELGSGRLIDSISMRLMVDLILCNEVVDPFDAVMMGSSVDGEYSRHHLRTYGAYLSNIGLNCLLKLWLIFRKLEVWTIDSSINS